MLRITQPPAYICPQGHTVSRHPADQQPSTIAFSWSQHPTHPGESWILRGLTMTAPASRQLPDHRPSGPCYPWYAPREALPMSYPRRNAHPHTRLSVPLLRLLLRFPSVTPGIPFHCQQSPWYPQPLPRETWFSPQTHCFLCSAGKWKLPGQFFLPYTAISMVFVLCPLRPRHRSHYVTLSPPAVICWPPGLALYLWKLLAPGPECSFSFQILPTSWPVWYVCEIFLTSQFLDSISSYLFHPASISQPHGHSDFVMKRPQHWEYPGNPLVHGCGLSMIPGWETKIPWAMWQSEQNKERREKKQTIAPLNPQLSIPPTRLTCLFSLYQLSKVIIFLFSSVSLFIIFFLSPFPSHPGRIPYCIHKPLTRVLNSIAVLHFCFICLTRLRTHTSNPVVCFDHSFTWAAGHCWRKPHGHMDAYGQQH